MMVLGSGLRREFLELWISVDQFGSAMNIFPEPYSLLSDAERAVDKFRNYKATIVKEY